MNATTTINLDANLFVQTMKAVSRFEDSSEHARTAKAKLLKAGESSPAVELAPGEAAVIVRGIEEMIYDAQGRGGAFWAAQVEDMRTALDAFWAQA